MHNQVACEMQGDFHFPDRKYIPFDRRFKDGTLSNGIHFPYLLGPNNPRPTAVHMETFCKINLRYEG